VLVHVAIVSVEQPIDLLDCFEVVAIMKGSLVVFLVQCSRFSEPFAILVCLGDESGLFEFALN